MERFSLPPTVRLVQAIYNYQGENNDELCITKGDIITVTNAPEGGWYEGTLNGTTGWFPSNYCRPLSPQEDNDTDGQQSNPAAQSNHSQQQDNLTFRKMVIREIVDSESAFIRELNSMQQHFLTLLHESRVLPVSETLAAREAISAIISSHSRFLNAIQSLEAGHKPNRSLRIGGLFMQFAAEFKQVHTDYCAIHPKFVSTIGQYKDAVAQLLRSASDDSQHSANLSLSNNLSFAFRRLDKYPALLQELQRYTDESDPDRGDTQRAGHFYRELVSHCLEVRRKKEMELEVMLGNIKEWPADVPSVQTFGPIVLMENVIVTHTPAGDVHLKDRYLVLFERDLLLLSISKEMTSFRFETRIPLSDLTLPRLPTASSEDRSIEMLVTKLNAGANSAGKFVFSFSSPDLAESCIAAMQQLKRKQEHVTVVDRTEVPVQQAAGSMRRKESESSSLSSESWQTERNPVPRPSPPVRKSPVYSLSSGYWSTHSLLPHPVSRLPDVDAGVAAKIKAKQTKAKPSDDMAILQVIEAYCPPGSTFKKKTVQTAASTAASSSSASDSVHPDLKSLTDEVRSLRREMKQMRTEMECLADGLRKEKEERKKLESLLSHSYRQMT